MEIRTGDKSVRLINKFGKEDRAFSQLTKSKDHYSSIVGFKDRQTSRNRPALQTLRDADKLVSGKKN